VRAIGIAIERKFGTNRTVRYKKLVTDIPRDTISSRKRSDWVSQIAAVIETMTRRRALKSRKKTYLVSVPMISLP
jgi:hypothetical protein